MKIKIIQNDRFEKIRKRVRKIYFQNWEIVGNISISSCYDPRCTGYYIYLYNIKKI